MWTYQLAGPGLLSRSEVPVPGEDELASGEMILRILAGGICGSDLPYFQGGFTSRSVLLGLGRTGGEDDVRGPLHEVVGEVVASQGDIEVGSRVVGWAGRRNNGFSEYMIGDDDWLHPVDLPLRAAHVVPIQPLACVLNALSRLPRIEGKRAAVLGLGSIGVLFTHALKAAGASHVTGVDRVDRTDMTARFGLDEVVCDSTRSWAASLSDGDRPDITIETVGHQIGTLNDAIEATAPQGSIFYFGIADDTVYPVAFERFMRKDLTLMAGATTRGRRGALVMAHDYLSRHQGLMEDYVTHILPFEQAQQAFDIAAKPSPNRLKVVMEG